MNDVQSLLLQVISEALFNKKAPDIAPCSNASGVNQEVKKAANPVSLKYSFGVLMALFKCEL